MIPTSGIKEDFIHFIWRNKLVPNAMYTVDGKNVEIIDFGSYNTNSGPDFLNGRIRIEDTIWVGNIEMHVYSRDWMKHGHHDDRAYDNVILHVVYEHDGDIYVQDRSIPTIALKGAIPRIYLDRYNKLLGSRLVIPCAGMIQSVPKIKIDMWKHALTVERLEIKSHQIAELCVQNNHNWEETFYVLLAKYFGSTINAEPMTMLARSLPLHVIYKNQHSKTAIDALLFGVAGFLKGTYEDQYYIDIKREWDFLSKKYDLSSMNVSVWKFGRLRPPNFPTVRIAQLASILARHQGLFSKIIASNDNLSLRQLFTGSPQHYWDSHYRFGQKGEPSHKDIAAGYIDILLINVVSPILYYYGNHISDDGFVTKAIDIIDNIKAEKNVIIKEWKELGIHSRTAYDSQALIQLKKNYCDAFRCMECKIGQEIMNTNDN
jgi:hypothetical protein